MSDKKLDAIITLLSEMHSDSVKMQSNFDKLHSDSVKMQSNFDKMQTDFVKLQSTVDEIKTDVAEIKIRVTRLEKHAVKTDRNFEIIKHQIQVLDKRTEQIEKQSIAIGIELKEDIKQLDKRVTRLEEEVFPTIVN